MKNVLFLFFLIPLFTNAQVKTLEVQGSSPDLYLVHTTGPKENFFSIGRIYNISPRVMAPYNQLVLEKGLSIGQVIRIPLNEVNFSQDGTAAADEALIPVYHKVKPKETLYGISTANRKVPVEALRKWNKISGDAVPNGSNMIIGFLKVKKQLSPLAGGGIVVEPVPAAVPEQPVTTTASIVTEPVKEVPVKKQPVAEIKNDVPVKKEEVRNNPPRTAGSRDFNGGVFKKLYNSQQKEAVKEKGEAGTFKSTSGWEDGKYYCLHNSARAGTIIQIINPANNRAVFAKVLDVIPDIRQNESLVIRISNAAADELGVTSENFECEINY